MKKMVIFSVLILVTVLVSDAGARREIMTPRQKELLQKADRVHVDMLALTDRGEVDGRPLMSVVERRLSEVGYTMVTDREQKYDVRFRVKCEQRKVWEGTMASGGDADLPDSPSRVWKGPACQLTYFLKGKNTGWRKEVRTDFQDSIRAAADASADDPGAYALEQLKIKLEQYDFPVLVTADWGQTQRLLKLLDDPNTPEARQVRIIKVLGEMFAADAVPRLSEATKDPNPRVATAATSALGDIGKQESIPLLVHLLKNGQREQRPVAAKALGNVGALNYDYSVIPPLIEALEGSDDIKVQTEAAWALGRLPDRRSLEPIERLQKELHTDMGPKVSPEVAELRKAVFWAWKQVDSTDQIN